MFCDDPTLKENSRSRCANHTWEQEWRNTESKRKPVRTDFIELLAANCFLQKILRFLEFETRTFPPIRKQFLMILSLALVIKVLNVNLPSN